VSPAPGQVARCLTRAQIGLTAPLVEVEVHLGSGLPTFFIVGLAATAVKESKERVRAALLNAHCEFPAGRITVNLAPADLPKDGGRFDLPIALGILAASGQLDAAQLRRIEFYGELGLGGELKSVRGLLLAATHAARDGHSMILPRADADEALLLGEGQIYAASHLTEVREHLSGHRPLGRCSTGRGVTHPLNARAHASVTFGAACGDLADVRGQWQAKRALLVAAAGSHSLLMVGPPGSGKSMLAQRLPALLPSLPPPDALEVASIAAVSAQGFDPRRWGQRPFRAPHHTATAQALIGGGPRAQPGEVSLAHHGVLFLDEIPEFDRRFLEALREPLEAGCVAVSRAAVQAVYPARFQLVAAMNPCPCGWHGSLGRVCGCAPSRIARYRGRLSGPLLDRIDLRIEVSPVPQEQLAVPAEREAEPERQHETSQAVAARVSAVRALQLARAGKLNAALEGAEVEHWCTLDARSRGLLERSGRGVTVSARSVHRLLRVARTLADLEEARTIAREHLSEAIQLRRALDYFASAIK
jgi:magnesium chelatase family protein